MYYFPFFLKFELQEKVTSCLSVTTFTWFVCPALRFIPPWTKERDTHVYSSVVWLFICCNIEPRMRCNLSTYPILSRIISLHILYFQLLSNVGVCCIVGINHLITDAASQTRYTFRFLQWDKTATHSWCLSYLWTSNTLQFLVGTQGLIRGPPYPQASCLWFRLSKDRWWVGPASILERIFKIMSMQWKPEGTWRSNLLKTACTYNYVSVNNRIKRLAPCRCLDGHVKQPYKNCLWHRDPTVDSTSSSVDCDVKQPIHLTSYVLSYVPSHIRLKYWGLRRLTINIGHHMYEAPFYYLFSISWYQKIEFLISRNHFFISRIRFLDIKKCLLRRRFTIY